MSHFPSISLSLSLSLYPFASLVPSISLSQQPVAHTFTGGRSRGGCNQGPFSELVRPISLLTLWISEGLTQAQS